MLNPITASPATSIVFIDSCVENFQHLISGVVAGTKVILLNAARDGVEQIYKVLIGYTHIEKIHIISHGSPGSLKLGNIELNLENLESYRDYLEKFFSSSISAIHKSRELLLYGCYIGAGIQGQTFVENLSQLTGANIAASETLTGSSALGGNWKLEVKTGSVKADLVIRPEVLETYSSVLSSFKPSVNFNAGTQPEVVIPRDFNKDGNLDLAVPNRNTNSISLLLGDGTGQFGDPTSFPAGQSPLFAFAEDFNKDNNLDLAVANGNANTVSIILGNGTGNFGTPTSFNVGTNCQFGATGDFNKDGNLDLVAVNFSSDNISILLGDGTGNFGNATNLSVGNGPLSVAVSDFNKDGNLDLAAANSSSNNVSILLGDGTGNFGAATTLPVGAAPSSLVVSDFNADGNPDITTANEVANTVSILMGDGTGNFSGATNFPGVKGPRSLTSADFNGDGILDLATANGPGTGGGNPNSISILEGTGTGSFGVATELTLNVNPWAISAADLNGDSNPDLMTANLFSSNVSILLNLPKVNFNAISYSSVEGTADTILNIPVTLNATPDTDVTVPIALNASSSAIQNSDYTLTTPSLIFPAGTTTLTQNLAVTIKPDNIPEAAETVVLDFGSITGAVAGPKKQATLTLAANGTLAYAVAAEANTIPEGNSGTQSLTFTVTRSGDIGGSSSVDYAIAGTAINGEDYNKTLATGTINFAAGETSKTISLGILGDAQVEADETVTITLSNPVGSLNSTLSQPTVSTTLINDDGVGIVVNPPSELTTTEAGGIATFTVKLNSQPAADVAIELSSSNPTEGTVSPALLTFTPIDWTQEKTVTVTGVEDNLIDGDRAYTIITNAASSSDSNYNGLNVADVAVTNSDNDVAVPTPIPTPTPTPVPTQTPIPTPIPTQTPIPTPVPIQTPIPTPVPTQTPIPTPVPTQIPIPTPVPTPTPAPDWCGVEQGLAKLETILDRQLQEIQIPIVGSLKDITPNFISNFKNRLIDAIQTGGNQAINQLESSIRNALEPDFKVQISRNSNTNEDTLLIKLAKEYQRSDIALSNDLGVPALGLNVDGTAKSNFNYELSLGVGFSKQFGCYINTDQTNLRARLDLELNNPFKVQGNLGFLQADFTNDSKNPTKVDADFELKLNDIDNLGGPDDGNRLTIDELQGNYQIQDLFKSTLTSKANLGLQGKTSVNGNVAFPSYNFDLAVQWPLFNYENGQLTTPKKPIVEFNNTQLDLGTFITNFAKPILGKISDVIDPIRPVVNFLTADTKILSQINLAHKFDRNKDKKVTLLEIASTLSGRDMDVRFLEAFAKIERVVQLADELSQDPGNFTLDFGSYTLGNIDVTESQPTQSSIIPTLNPLPAIADDSLTDSPTKFALSNSWFEKVLNTLRKSDLFSPTNTPISPTIPNLPTEEDILARATFSPKDFVANAEAQIRSKASGKIQEFIEALEGIEGLGLPILTNPKTAMELLLGKPDVNLFTYQMPKLSINLNISAGFPIVWPISGLIEGSFQALSNLGFGYDTYGLKEWKKSNFSPASANKVLDGFYLSDRENADGTGSDVNELELLASIAVGGGVDVKLLSGYIKGGLQGSVGIDLIDIGEFQPQKGGDGKIRTSEITSRIGQPQELFDVRGAIEGFLGIKIKSFFRTLYDKKLAKYKLADFSLGPKASSRGRAINSYLTSGLVFFDANLSGLPDEDELFTFTNDDGSFDLDIPLVNFDKNNSGAIEPEEGKIVIADGFNPATALPQQTPLWAPSDATTVTPLTTLMAELIQRGSDRTQAETQVKTALGVLPEIQLTNYDPIQTIAQNDPKGLAVYALHAQIQNTLAITTNLISGAATVPPAEIANAAIAAIGRQIQGGKALNLGDPVQIQTILESVAGQLQVPQVSQIAPQAAQLIAEGNQRIQASATPNQTSLTDAVAEMIRLQQVAQGEVANDLKQAASGSKAIAEAIAENTGVALDRQLQDLAKVTNADNLSLGSDGIQFANPSENTAESTDGNDTLLGSSGDDTLWGRKGSDLLVGFAGNDWMNANQQDDFADGGDGNDTLYGGKRMDMLTGGTGDDWLSGNRSDDTLAGEEANDTLWGGRGNDLLLGLEGNDSLAGDLGDDTLEGGEGSDRFCLGPDTGIDTILDFEDSQDFIVLENGMTFSQLAIIQAENETFIQFVPTGKILASLQGVSAIQLDLNDFFSDSLLF